MYAVLLITANVINRMITFMTTLSYKSSTAPSNILKNMDEINQG